MRKIITLFIISLMLTACVRKISIEQGNIIAPEVTQQLRPGMTTAEVTHIMGSPVLLNTFNDNRFDYVYTYQPGRSQMTEKVVTLTFENERLKTITTK